MSKHRIVLGMGFAVLACVLSVGCKSDTETASPEDQVITLATTTSTENSGLLAYLHPDFEEKTGIRVKVVAKGTGASLQMARDGDADVVLVHAPEMEEAFVAEGYGVERVPVMYNDFVIIGPADDPAGAKDAVNAAEALKKIADSDSKFISRGDNSGTHAKEQALWKVSGVPTSEGTKTVMKKGEEVEITCIAPDIGGDEYISIGQGMGETLARATQDQAYTIADRGTYYAYALAETPRTDLVIVSEGDEALFNPYGVIAVDPEKHPHAQIDLANQYIEWLTSPETQDLIGKFEVGGKVLFHPSAGTH